MDNLTLQALVQEYRLLLTHRRCVQVTQFGPRGIALELSRRDSRKLLFDLTEPPLSCLTEKSWSFVPLSSFVGLLRKWLVGSELESVQKSLDERVVHFAFARLENEFHTETFSLVAEMMPRWGNLYLLDSAHRVLGALLPNHAERRHLETGVGYMPPRRHGEISLQSFMSAEGSCPELPPDLEELTKRVTGLGPVFAREVLMRSRNNQQHLSEVLKQLLRQFHSGEFRARAYPPSITHPYCFVSPFELESMDTTAAASFDSVNKALEFAFEKRHEGALVETEKTKFRKHLQALLKRFRRIEEKLVLEEKGFAEEAAMQRVADLILSQPGEWRPVNGRIELTDLLDTGRPKVTVEIDPRLSAVANAQRFYEKAKRARRGLGKIQLRHHQIHQTVVSIEAALNKLSTSTTLSVIEEIRGSLDERRITNRDLVPKNATNRVDAALTPSPRSKPKKKCRIFESSDHCEILLGRNSKENDLVTTHYAKPDDYWFHVADYAGSHVVLRNPAREDLQDSSGFLEAAQLAAYFSQARNANKVLVHWTQRKFVKKPKRAKPGLVTLSKFQSITVEPKLLWGGQALSPKP
jgi:predicted ribosome quality control (RQC) complex YloA/Tae2 family protein